MDPDDLPRKVDAIRDVLANLHTVVRPIDALSDDKRIAVLHRVADGLDVYAAFAGVPNNSKKNTQELRLDHAERLVNAVLGLVRSAR